MTIMQGDSYPLYFQVVDGEDTPVSIDEIEKVEILLGEIYKVYPCEDVLYDQEKECFVLRLRQQDTFKLSTGSQILQFRVKGKDQNVTGWLNGTKITVIPSKSKEVL